MMYNSEYERTTRGLARLGIAMVILGLMFIAIFVLAGDSSPRGGAAQPAAPVSGWDFEGCRCSEDAFDCEDAEALRCFEVCKRSIYFDPHGLDRDLDGTPCSGRVKADGDTFLTD